MFRKLKRLFLITIPLLWGSCAPIYVDLPPCEVYLEFVFDYNMEYANSFSSQINAVDVYVFDSEDKLKTIKRARTEELIDGNKMSLTADLKPGSYKVLAIGALGEKFLVHNHEDQPCSEGITTIEDVRIALARQSDMFSDSFPHMWVAKTTEISFSASESYNKVWPVHFVRNTNVFNFVLVDADGQTKGPASGDPAVSPYTFEVVTPEAAVYSSDNEPVNVVEHVTYAPYALYPGESPDKLSVGNLNTCRLFDRENYGYQLLIRDTQNSSVAFQYDLMTLLKYLKPQSRPDGTPLPFQEYLDRQGEWHVVLIAKVNPNPATGDAFLAIGVEVNDWIIWLTDIGV